MRPSLLLLLPLLSCAPAPSDVVVSVTVTGLTPSVVALQVNSVTLNGKMAVTPPAPFTSSLDRIGFELHAGSRGAFAVDLAGLNAKGAAVAEGKGSTNISADGSVDMTVALMPIAEMYTLTVTPMGTGSVSSQPTGIDCGMKCSALFPSGSLVALTASPENSADLFWSGACMGGGACQVTMNAPQMVTASFPRWHKVESGVANSLNGVWAANSSTVWVVGDAGVFQHYDGTAWSTLVTNDTRPLRAVWGSGTRDLWAVGGTTGMPGAMAAALHYDGNVVSGSDVTTTHTLTGVWGSGPADVWAVCDAAVLGANGAIHYNGSMWSGVVPAVAPGDKALRAIWGTAANNIWAVGDMGRIIQYNGSAWTTVMVSFTANLNGVWGSGAADVWAVGSGGTILHYNGSAWSQVTSGTGSTLNGVWGSGAGDVWAVGQGGVILHNNGAGWAMSKSSPGSQVAGFNSVFGTGPMDVWAVGQGGAAWHYHP